MWTRRTRALAKPPQCIRPVGILVWPRAYMILTVLEAHREMFYQSRNGSGFLHITVHKLRRHGCRLVLRDGNKLNSSPGTKGAHHLPSTCLDSALSKPLQPTVARPWPYLSSYSSNGNVPRTGTFLPSAGAVAPSVLGWGRWKLCPKSETFT